MLGKIGPLYNYAGVPASVRVSGLARGPGFGEVLPRGGFLGQLLGPVAKPPGDGGKGEILNRV